MIDCLTSISVRGSSLTNIINRMFMDCLTNDNRSIDFSDTDVYLLRYVSDRFSIQNIPKQVDECDFVADIGFLIDASNSIREDYLSELQFVKHVAARFVINAFDFFLPPIPNG